MFSRYTSHEGAGWDLALPSRTMRHFFFQTCVGGNKGTLQNLWKETLTGIT